MRSELSVSGVLQARAADQSAQRAYVWIDEHLHEEASLTYGELHARALAVAAQLAAQCRPGDRALLVFPPGLDFIVAYFGCLYAHVIAVPVNPPRREAVQGATRSVVSDCAPSAVLTLSALVDFMKPPLESVCGELRWLAVDQVADGDTSFEPQPCSVDSIAFLQYTSGSTSDPKGVMVTHGNLTANEEMIRRAFGRDQHSTVVGWVPFFHDQGLIGNVLQPLWCGSTSILMSPLVFSRWPLAWLSAISRYRAHTSGGPNFAFEVCVARAAGGKNVPEDLELSCWETAFNGAEPIRLDTLRRFTETFAPYGFSEQAFYPCYGLAEATLIVAGSVKGRGARTVEADVEELARGRFAAAPAGGARTLVGAGRILPEDELRIVDPATGRPCAANEIGEIWVSGPNVAKGYWRRPDATADVFGAEYEGEPGRTYLRTGDLGIVIEDEVYVVGRLKDLIIIRGRNIYPHDVELTAQSAHPALRKGACAAFAVPGGDGEKLVVVQEVKRDQQADPADVAQSIRAAIVREHDVALGDLVLAQARELPKTSSGKIMRAAARKRYLEATFERWAPESPSPLDIPRPPERIGA
jgi:acyl-CoA synthetase (AMP-forming)/AMP-acid ligase II